MADLSIPGPQRSELLGEDDMRGLVEDADFDGPLVDALSRQQIESMGHDQVDGDDATAKVTLKNGDIFTTTLILIHTLNPD